MVKYMKWYIGNVELKNQVVVAPMAGVTNPAFRKIAKEFGAGLIYTEMVSDKGLGHNNVRTREMLRVDLDEKPISLQISRLLQYSKIKIDRRARISDSVDLCFVVL